MKRAASTDARSDELRWRDAGRPTEMTLEERARYIADAWRPRGGGDGGSSSTWLRIYNRALEQLREIASQGEPPF